MEKSSSMTEWYSHGNTEISLSYYNGTLECGKVHEIKSKGSSMTVTIDELRDLKTILKTMISEGVI